MPLFRRPRKPKRPKVPSKSLLKYLSSERVAKGSRRKPPATVGRPQTNRLRVPPTKATQKPVAKPKAVTVTGKKPPAPKPKRTHGDPIPKRRVPKKDITKAVDYDRRGPTLPSTPKKEKVKARIDPVKRQPIRRLPKGKSTDATIDYFDKDGKRIIKSVEGDRRILEHRRRPPTTPTPKKPPRPRTTPRPRRPRPKDFQALIEELKRRAKPQEIKGVTRPPRPPKNEVGIPPKRDPKLIIPDTFKGYKKISAAEAGFKGPPRGSYVTQAFQTFHNPTTGQMVTVPTGGYTAPKGWIRGRPKDEFYRKPIAIRPGLATDPSGKPTTISPDIPEALPARPLPRPPTRPPSNNVEKFLAGRKPEELNRQDKIRFQKEIYIFNQEQNKRNIIDARQRLMDRFRNDPTRLQFEMAKLNRDIRIGDAVQKFRAGMISSNVLRQLGVPQRDIRQLMHQKRMFFMPETPRKYQMHYDFRMSQLQSDLRNRIRAMQRQGASRQEMLRLKVDYNNEFARMKKELDQVLFRKFGKKPTTGKAPLPLRPRLQPRGFATKDVIKNLFGPR